MIERRPHLEIFAQTLTLLRQRQVWTVYALAKKSGLSQQFIAAMERGEKFPSLETARRLSQALAVSLGEFDSEEKTA